MELTSVLNMDASLSSHFKTDQQERENSTLVAAGTNLVT